MTKFQKKMLTIAAAGALTAVTALPAMALENQFSGTFAVKTFVSNFDAYGLQLKESATADNYTEQRMRIGYTAKASDDLKLVTQFEFDTRWGYNTNVAAGVGDNTGGAVDTDSINIQTRWAYLDFNVNKDLNIKAGQMPFKDVLKGLYVDADLPMMLATYKSGPLTLGLGYSRFNDAATTAAANVYRGELAAELYALQGTYALNKDTAVSLAYYANRDDKAGEVERLVNTFGVSAQSKVAGIDLSGMAAMQFGTFDNAGAETDYDGYAFNLVAKQKLANGTAKVGFLYASGDDDATDDKISGWQTLSSNGAAAFQNTYSDSGMMLLVRNTGMGGTTTDSYFRKPVTDVMLGHLGYDATLSPKTYVNANIGFAWAPSATKDDFMGTELNVEVGYKLYSNLTIKAQVAYVALGNLYDGAAAGGKDPADPYTVRLGAMYSF